MVDKKGENMPEFELAIRELPVQTFLEAVRAGGEGIDVADLVASLEENGLDRRIILRVLQSQFDSGAITLTREMKIYAKPSAVAA